MLSIADLGGLSFPVMTLFVPTGTRIPTTRMSALWPARHRCEGLGRIRIRIAIGSLAWQRGPPSKGVCRPVLGHCCDVMAAKLEGPF